MYFTVIITKQIDFYDKAICRLWYKYPTIWINYTIVCNAESVTLPIRQTDPKPTPNQPALGYSGCRPTCKRFFFGPSINYISWAATWNLYMVSGVIILRYSDRQFQRKLSCSRPLHSRYSFDLSLKTRITAKTESCEWSQIPRINSSDTIPETHW